MSTLTDEQKKRVMNSLHANNADEAAFLHEYVQRAFPGFCQPYKRPAKDTNDYEAAIMARQEASGMYD